MTTLCSRCRVRAARGRYLTCHRCRAYQKEYRNRIKKETNDEYVMRQEWLACTLLNPNLDIPENCYPAYGLEKIRE